MVGWVVAGGGASWRMMGGGSSCWWMVLDVKRRCAKRVDGVVWWCMVLGGGV